MRNDFGTRPYKSRFPYKAGKTAGKKKQGYIDEKDESIGMRLGKGKGTAKERDMSYGKWGNRGKDWAKSGKMIKARHGTEVRTMGSNPFTPKGSVVGVQTKLNGTVKTRVY